MNSWDWKSWVLQFFHIPPSCKKCKVCRSHVCSSHDTDTCLILMWPMLLSSAGLATALNFECEACTADTPRRMMTLWSPEPPVHWKSSFPRGAMRGAYICPDGVVETRFLTVTLNCCAQGSSLIELSGVWLRYGWAYLGRFCPRVHSYTAIRVDILALKSPIPSGHIGSILFLLSVAFRYLVTNWIPKGSSE